LSAEKKQQQMYLLDLGIINIIIRLLRSNLVYKALFKEKYVIGTAFGTGIQNEI
jgi:hypothetical protein